MNWTFLIDQDRNKHKMKCNFFRPYDFYWDCMICNKAILEHLRALNNYLSNTKEQLNVVLTWFLEKGIRM